MVLPQLNWRITLRKCVTCGLLLTLGITVSVVFVTSGTFYKVNDRSVPGRRFESVSEHTVDVDSVDNVGDAPMTSLIDMPLNFNYSHTTRHIKYTILWYNPVPYIRRYHTKLKLETCQYNNCQLKEDKQHLNDSKVIIFGINMQTMENAPPVSYSQRDPNQIWTYFAREPPILRRYAFNIKAWNNTMNWSMTVGLDSDVAFPYGMFKTRPEPYTNEPDYGKIYDMKTKMAVWVVSNCHPKSRRQEFALALQNAGIAVDIFGKCGDLGKRFHGDISDLVRPYKFYLSLENSFCKYYVTEKVISRYNDDVIMLIRGGADYSRLMPNDTYVNAAMFPNVTSLAKHLLDLSSNKTRYIELLRNKHKYQSIGPEFTYPRAMCDLCRKLNNLDGIAKKSIVRVDTHNLEEGRCIGPRNIVIQ